MKRASWVKAERRVLISRAWCRKRKCPWDWKLFLHIHSDGLLHSAYGPKGWPQSYSSSKQTNNNPQGRAFLSRTLPNFTTSLLCYCTTGPPRELWKLQILIIKSSFYPLSTWREINSNHSSYQDVFLCRISKPVSMGTSMKLRGHEKTLLVRLHRKFTRG